MDTLITALVVHYKTPTETLKCLQAFRYFYTDKPLLLIDNSNYDKSSDQLYQFAQEDKHTTCIFNTFNLHHGPSMDLGLHILKTPQVFIMDSDLLIVQPNLVEDMYNTTLNRKDWLMVGNLCYVNDKGFNLRGADQQHPDAIKYCNPKCMLVNRQEYFKWRPCTLHGAPMIHTMNDLKLTHCEHLLIDFDWPKYAKHLGGVTQKTHGLDGKGGMKIPPFI